MTDQMPQVNAEFGTTPVIEFPTPEAPKGLKVVELTEGDGPIVRRGDTVTVNYHGVVWGKDTPFDSSFDRHQPPVSASAWDRSSRAGTRLCRAITWVRVWWFPFRRNTATVPAASRRPASAARTRWCSSSTSFPPADHRSAHDERRGHSRRFVINNEDCFSIDNGSGGRYG